MWQAFEKLQKHLLNYLEQMLLICQWTRTQSVYTSQKHSYFFNLNLNGDERKHPETDFGLSEIILNINDLSSYFLECGVLSN